MQTTFGHQAFQTQPAQSSPVFAASMPVSKAPGKLNAGPAADVFFGGSRPIEDPVQLKSGVTMSATLALSLRRFMKMLLNGTKEENAALVSLRQHSVPPEHRKALYDYALIRQDNSIPQEVLAMVDASLVKSDPSTWSWVDHPFKQSLDEVITAAAQGETPDDLVTLRNGSRVSQDKVETITALIRKMATSSELGKGGNLTAYRLWLTAENDVDAKLEADDIKNLQAYGLADHKGKITDDTLAIASGCYERENESRITVTEPFALPSEKRQHIGSQVAAQDSAAMDIVFKLENLGDRGVETLAGMLSMNLVGFRLTKAMDLFDGDIKALIQAVDEDDTLLRALGELPPPPPMLALTDGKDDD